MSYYNIDVYLADEEDVYAPVAPKNILQRLDNYQIYSLILCEYSSISSGIKKVMVPVSSGGDYGSYGFYSTQVFYYTTTEGFNNPPPIVGRTALTSATKMIAFQRFSVEKIPINFDEVAQKLNVKPNDIRICKYVSSSGMIKTTSDTLPNGPAPINIRAEYYDVAANNNGLDPLQYSYVSRDHVTVTPGSFTGNSASSTNVYKLIQDRYTSVGTAPILLDMYALITGYSADSRLLADDYPTILPNATGEISIKYYRQNPLENVPNVISIDWITYSVKLTKGSVLRLPIIKPIFGTLIIDGEAQLVSDVKSQLSTTESNRYKWSDYLVENIDSLVDEWKQIHDDYTLPAAPSSNLLVFGNIDTQYLQPLNRVLSANNNYWNNDSNNYADLNVPNTNPQYGFIGGLPRVLSIANSIPNSREKAYDWHIKPQPDGSRGELIMDSPRTIEIHKALNAGKYAINELDTTKQRVTDLGFLVERIAKVLGIRFDANGKIDEKLEKTTNRRQHAESKEKNDLQEYNPNCFGSKGMLVRYLPNKFKPKGKDVETIEGGFRKVKDIPQLLAELHEQANAAMGYQEGTAIEITVDDETYRYPNQLALLTEIFVTLKQSGVYSKGAFFSSVVAEQSIKEVIGGLGLRTVDKYLEFKIAGKTAKLYYKGISASQSIRRKLSAISTNIGTIIGNIT